ncbi:calcium-binding protein [Pseudomonas sp. rhizo66]|uniref:calcium-binding protein n=1 Tax=Pseudomonas sp. rhizo66 TaxID=3059674 RepID=UPI0028906A0B|nr:calcium-binding protein [Pseudomonas sp. rhizo66]MDT3311279.1 calcium-binding protein [Pseudomonas sp. rhizo66]
MSKLIAPPAHMADQSLIQVTAVSASANPHAPQAGTLNSAMPAEDADAAYRRTLKSLDKHFGPLRIGEILTSRVELQALGATVHGQPISPANAGMQRVDQHFLDGLNFDADRVQARLLSVDTPDSNVAAMLFYEIACKRSVDAGALFVADTTIDPGSAVDRLNQLGKAAQKLDIHRADALENAPGWISKNKSYLMSGAGVGMQAFGIYSGYKAMIDAIKHGDTLEAFFQGGSIAAEFGSLIIERGLTKTGEAMLRNGGNALKYFPLTSVGKYMSRGAGMFASAITLPFDIADAIKSFNAAAAAQGKAAQDHYVSGGLSVAGAGISLVLGVAALAGFGSVAGPVGLVAAGLLIAASMIYQAARVVDDIDDYIELTFEERLRSGWFAFTNKELDSDVLDRFKLAKGYRDHQRQLELSARDMLENAYKHSIEHVINGAFQVELKPVEIWRYQWNESAGQQPFKLDNQAVVVGGDDVIDAGKGLPANLKGKVSGSAGDDKGIFWRLGDGNDRVIGVANKPNLFTYRADHKALTGGDRNDAFYQDITEQELNLISKPAHLNVLDGGAGSDTLAFEGSRPLSDTRHIGHDINLHSGRVALRGLDPEVNAVEVAQLTSIENVSTLRRGTSRVSGNDEANQISANGYDRISAGAGDDTIALYGRDCRVEGGSGADRFYIASSNARTTIVEDGEASSLIEFGWPAEIIQRWQIVGTSLVISSLRGEDGHDPEHVLTLENVYQWVDGKRQLNNDRFRFKTQDGYELLVQLPRQPGEASQQDITPVVVVIGQPAAAPQIVNGGIVEIAEQGLKQHFLARTERQVEFVAQRNTAETARTVYLEFDSAEIIDVQVSYQVQVRKGVSGTSHLYYTDFTLSVRLPSKVVMFKGVIQTIAAATGYSGRNSLKVTTPRLQQNVVLILQDQVSYRLQVPVLNYEDDAKNPGTRVRSTRSCLKQRKGNYRFVRPLASVKPLITAEPSRITIETGSHTGIYVLDGQSSTYDVHLASNTIIRLSTPGAAAKTADASTWTLYTHTLKETVTRDDIQLDGNRLRIASVTVELPDIEDDAPVESINVATSAGNIYEVSLLFEVLQLYVIDARGYADVEALLAEINAHQQRNELAARVHVTHIGINTGTIGTVVYNSVRKHWSLASAPLVPINLQDLVFPIDKT